MQYLVILAAFIAAAAAVTVVDVPHCRNFPQCQKVPYSVAAECPPDDEDCHHGSGSGSGSGSGDGEEVDTCMESGNMMKLVCNEPARSTTPPTIRLTTNTPTVVTSQVPATTVPRTHSTTATVPVDVVTVQSETQQPETPVRDTHTPRPPTQPPKQTATTEGSNLVQPGNNDQNKAEKGSSDDDDKAWMIGVIIGCVIGSAILGVLAAVVVIKLKYSGSQNGSFHSSSERGSTASSSSQKPLYV